MLSFQLFSYRNGLAKRIMRVAYLKYRKRSEKMSIKNPYIMYLLLENTLEGTIKELRLKEKHCVKIAQILSFFWFVFEHFSRSKEDFLE